MCSGKSYKQGLFGERVVINYLCNCGYSVLHHRYKTKYGELDVVAYSEQRKLLLFVEVKTYKKNSIAYRSMELVSYKQIVRNSNAASCFLSENQQFDSYLCRFDLALVSSKGEIMKYFESAWESE